LNISLSIYCDDQAGVLKSQKIITNYAHQFLQVIVILNTTEQAETSLTQLGRNILVLDLQGSITHGAALNKLLPHVITHKVLLIDAHLNIAPGLVKLIYHLDKKIDLTCPYLVGFNQPKTKDGQTPELWKNGLYFASTLSWGSLFFDPSFLLSFGGFQDRLSHELLMVDLCWRAQKSEGVLLGTIEPLGTLDKILNKSSYNELKYIQEQYPELYQVWFNNFFGIIKKQSQSLNAHLLN
jgi:hypothetical protein